MSVASAVMPPVYSMYPTRFTGAFMHEEARGRATAGVRCSNVYQGN